MTKNPIGENKNRKNDKDSLDSQLLTLFTHLNIKFLFIGQFYLPINFKR